MKVYQHVSHCQKPFGIGFCCVSSLLNILYIFLYFQNVRRAHRKVRRAQTEMEGRRKPKWKEGAKRHVMIAKCQQRAGSHDRRCLSVFKSILDMSQMFLVLSGGHL